MRSNRRPLRFSQMTARVRLCANGSFLSRDSRYSQRAFLPAGRAGSIARESRCGNQEWQAGTSLSHRGDRHASKPPCAARDRGKRLAPGKLRRRRAPCFGPSSNGRAPVTFPSLRAALSADMETRLACRVPSVLASSRCQRPPRYYS
jgi:hypothetical protein